jgi:DNA-binding XRE family transcriptional regulator
MTGGAAARKKPSLKERLGGHSIRSRKIGNEAKRGSFDTLVGDIERAARERGEEPPLSSAAFRAGSLIRMMRKSRSLTQAALAKRIGVTQARVSELESGMGSRGPSWELMERIAKACSATILISPTESDIAIDASEPANAERQWTLAATGG